MPTIKWLAFMVLAATIVPSCAAETHCPGNVASVPFRFVSRHWIVLAVSINHTGPYNFLLDTGTQVTMIDRSLAATLNVDTQGLTIVAGVGPDRSASYAQLDLVEAGSHAVANRKVLVYDLRDLHSAGPHVQGILGEDVLEQFDLLIDNAHHVLCFDDSAAMRAEVKGAHIPLAATAEADEVCTPPGFLVITVRLSDALRPVRLVIDSGADEPILFNTSQYMVLPPSHVVPVRASGVDGAQPVFSVLPPQEVKNQRPSRR